MQEFEIPLLLDASKVKNIHKKPKNKIFRTLNANETIQVAENKLNEILNENS